MKKLAPVLGQNKNEEGMEDMEFEKLQEIIAEVLNVDADEITMDTTFVDDLGADSLDVFQIIMGIEEVFDIEIANEDAEKIVSVGDAVEQIKNAIN
jgi:acyl carrier protein